MDKDKLKGLMKAATKVEDKQVKKAKAALTALNKTDLQPIFQLDEEGDRLFGMVINYLDERGLIEQVDVITCTMLAKSLAVYITMARAVQTEGDIVQAFENGASNVTGAFTAMNKAQDQVMKLSAKLGLSPMDRTRIFGAATAAEAASDKSQSGDEIDNLM